MKNIFVITTVIAAGILNASAAFSLGIDAERPMCTIFSDLDENCMTPGANANIDDSCYMNTPTSACKNCTSTTSTTITHVIAYTPKAVRRTCTATSMSCSCEIDSSRATYKCEAGYYGNPTSIFSQCHECPSNATCPLDNNKTFKCNAGYYASGSSCVKCPTPGTSAAGATSVTKCYVPANTEYTDTSGKYSFSSTCYYSN